MTEKRYAVRGIHYSAMEFIGFWFVVGLGVALMYLADDAADLAAIASVCLIILGAMVLNAIIEEMERRIERWWHGRQWPHWV